MRRPITVPSVRWLALVLGTVALFNFLVTPLLPTGGRPIRIFPSTELTQLVMSQGVASRFGIYMLLSDLEPSLVVTHSPDVLSRDILGGLTQVNLEIRDYDPGIHGLADLGRSTGRTRTIGLGELPFWLIEGSPGDMYWTGVYSDGIVLIPSSLLEPPGGEE